jgi:hypothetical protein
MAVVQRANKTAKVADGNMQERKLEILRSIPQRA